MSDGDMPKPPPPPAGVPPVPEIPDAPPPPPPAVAAPPPPAADAVPEAPPAPVEEEVPHVPPAPPADEEPLYASIPAPVDVPDGIPESQFSDPADRETIHEIQQHTSKFGRIAGALLVVSALAIGGFAVFQNQSEEASLERIREIGQIDDRDQMLAELRTLLGEVGSQDLRQRIIMNLGHFKDEQAVPILIEELGTAGKVRRSAAWALAEIGLPAAEPAKPALLAVLPDVDERDEAQVIWTLAVLGEPAAGDAILEAFGAGKLQNLDGFSARVIVDVLGPERLASDTLLSHDEESVRVLTAHALAEAHNAQVIEPLTRLLTAELAREPDARSREVIRAAAAGLGRTGDSRAAAPLFNVLQNQPNLRSPVLDALKKSTGAVDLAVLVGEARDVELRRSLVTLLAATHDDRGADALVARLDDEDLDIRRIAAFALADLGDVRAMEALFVLANDTEHRDTAADAIEKIGLIATPDASAGLLALLRTNPRKATILRALGRTGDQDVARFIEAELDGDDAPSAGRAIADLNNDGAYRQLYRMIVRPRAIDMAALNMGDRAISNEELIRKRKVAIMAMGQYGRPEALEPLMTIVEDGHDDFELRSLAAASIGQIADSEQMITIFGKLADSSLSETTRRYYVQALWQRPHEGLNDRLLTLMADANQGPDVRRAAALALGYAANDQNDIRLVEMLGVDETARGAAFAIILGGGETSVAALMEELGDNSELREVVAEYVMNEQYAWFDLLTENMFETGSIWRRLHAARQLQQGDGQNTYAYAWNKILELLRSGSERPHGASRRFIREQLWLTLNGEDEARRTMAALLLEELGERGLLLRARDEGGTAGEAARAIIAEREAVARD